MYKKIINITIKQQHIFSCFAFRESRVFWEFRALNSLISPIFPTLSKISERATLRGEIVRREYKKSPLTRKRKAKSYRLFI